MEALKIASYPILALFVIMVLLCVGGIVKSELLEYITLALMPVSGICLIPYICEI